MKFSLPEIKTKILSALLLFSLLILPQFNVFGQTEFPQNGYYVTLKNDTIYSNLENQGGMYLVYKNAKGKKHKFTPSQIRSFCINQQEYIPLFINEMGSKRYVAVMIEFIGNALAFADVLVDTAIARPVAFRIKGGHAA